MLRRTGQCLSGYSHVARDMIRVWRMYGHRVGEVHAHLHNLHWSVDDHMLRSYFEQFATCRTCHVNRDSIARRNARDARRKYGRSLGTADIIFHKGQNEKLAHIFKTRHVLNGKEILMLPADKQPEFNFYIPNTHEKEADELDPEIVAKMSQQVVNLHMTVTGKFAHPTISHLQRQRDLARRKNFKQGGEQHIHSHDEPWFFGQGEEKWGQHDPDTETGSGGTGRSDEARYYNIDNDEDAEWADHTGRKTQGVGMPIGTDSDGNPVYANGPRMPRSTKQSVPRSAKRPKMAESDIASYVTGLQKGEYGDADSEEFTNQYDQSYEATRRHPFS